MIKGREKLLDELHKAESEMRAAINSVSCVGNFVNDYEIYDNLNKTMKAAYYHVMSIPDEYLDIE